MQRTHSNLTPPAFPDLPLGPGYRRLTHRVSTRIFHWGGRALYGVLRRRSKTLPQLEAWPFQTGPEKPVPILYAFSPEIVPRPADWSDRSVMTGYWFREPGEVWDLPEAVTTFLRQPRKKVYIGLGSMVPGLDRDLRAIFLEVLEFLGLTGLMTAADSQEAPVALGKHSL